MIEIENMTELKTVEITTLEYEKMIENSYKLILLEKALINNAGLSYTGTKLTFNADEICAVIKAIFPEKYGMKLAELRDQNEA